MEYGGLFVKEGTRTGTPWMLLWCAGSSASSMKVRTLNVLYLHLVFRLHFYAGSHYIYSPGRNMIGNHLKDFGLDL